jgi:hypothetical protein
MQVIPLTTSNAAIGDEESSLVSGAPVERSERGAEAIAEAITCLAQLSKRLLIIYYHPPY